MIQKIETIIFLLCFISCSYFQVPNGNLGSDKDIETFGQISAPDYLEHLNYLGDIFLNGGQVKIVQLNKELKDYLSSVADELVNSNELVITIKKRPTFVIIEEDRPIFFGLPDYRIVLSTGLIRKYIKNEVHLISVIAFELFRVSSNAYIKRVSIPTGYISLELFLSHLRIPSTEKIELHKWAYYMMRRTGYDADGYLSWLQIQNRNALDFYLNQGDLDSISKEEYMFKSFMIKGFTDSKKVTKMFNRSKFYLLLKGIEGS